MLQWLPRRSCFSVKNANLRSTRLIQDAPFGVKCRCYRPGAPRTVIDAAVERVVTLTLETTRRDALEHARHGAALRPEPEHREPDTIDAVVPEDLDAHLIVDNYATHKTTLIRHCPPCERKDSSERSLQLFCKEPSSASIT